ncbi:hypothetical protein CVT24_007135 [Panaeolus cyanescens]|uniref:Tyr recombinase domain-containing protein n=1 Tax=Panaeolus cyanescens TaxID=181874 RepID=A0A409YX32_9AGAR|nr:hypothetical protein CVT24_007135 [Panaeolus cyanescens]
MPPLVYPPVRTSGDSVKHLRKRPLFDTSSKLFTKSLSIPSYFLPTSDYDNILSALNNCYATSTQDTHSRALKHYHIFCDERAIPSHLRFPAHEVILLAYAASHFGSLSGGTARHRINALKTFHDVHNLPWHGSNRLTKILKGVTFNTPISSTRPPRAPITTSMLKRLLNKLDLETPLDAAVAACACTAFWGQCRLGELLPSSSTSSPSGIPKREHLSRSASKRGNLHSYELLLPSTKTNRRGQTITILRQEHTSNPLPLLQNHLAVNNLPRSTTLFSYISSSHNTPTPLSKRRFLARCNNIWSTFGYPRITGHSFRIGGTSQLLASGIPPDVVKTMGRWSSDTFLRYWRHMDRIAPAQTPHPHTRHHRNRTPKHPPRSPHRR